ncbi:hypothetical protein CC80DRAFT_62601 [Byssothecium circinans]|uniref:Uncharacterized protein n=1 Tax=Byssothecium circinans TaxID=147558 RepID=A0A6A5U0X8_9PLEO|nr:hypothetical protein CC80DRAFT_62601 [Byssothecium circinans]
MPADRRPTFPAAKPIKTERTHEENQERAYIAASRRSDRSLEARIESARRASEIHKKRTGRALRVTEQDVVNEEMYEEEDDDLPTQYQRLNAHLQTSSWLFNRKLHDYIATQHGVRNMFLLQQFPGHALPQYGSQVQSNGQIPMMNQTMQHPQNFTPASPAFTQPSHPYSPQQPFQQQPLQQQSLQQQPLQQPHSYRHAPYSIPQRQHMQHRSASISTPLPMPSVSPTVPPATSTVTSPYGDFNRRLSLPPNAFDPSAQPSGDASSRPPMSRSTTAQSIHQQPVSPQHVNSCITSGPNSGQATPQPQFEHGTPSSYQYPSLPFDGTSSQVINTNPLSMSLPPESQQFVGSALDPNDPRTAILMAGSDNLPQPFYTYNPNLSPKAARKAADQVSLNGSGMSQTLSPDNAIKAEACSNSPPSAMMDNYFSSHPLFTPTGFGYPNYFDQHQGAEGNQTNEGPLNDSLYEENSFVDWDQ